MCPTFSAPGRLLNCTPGGPAELCGFASLITAFTTGRSKGSSTPLFPVSLCGRSLPKRFLRQPYPLRGPPGSSNGYLPYSTFKASWLRGAAAGGTRALVALLLPPRWWTNSGVRLLLARDHRSICDWIGQPVNSVQYSINKSFLPLYTLPRAHHMLVELYDSCH